VGSIKAMAQVFGDGAMGVKSFKLTNNHIVHSKELLSANRNTEGVNPFKLTNMLFVFDSFVNNKDLTPKPCEEVQDDCLE
jgi:hypothetical protein